MKPRSGLRLGATLACALLLSLASAADAVAPASGPVLNPASPGASSGCPSKACSAVLSLVAKATHLKKLPTNLQPSLQDTADDLVNPPTSECVPIAQLQSDNGYNTACTYSYSTRPSTPMMVLIGDSHAWMWATSLILVARRSHYNITELYKASCRLPLITYANTPGDPTNAQCLQWKQDAISWIDKHHPALVIATTQDKPATDGNGNVVTQTRWTAAFAAFLRKLASPGRRLAVLGDIAQLSQDGPSCLAAHESDVQLCSTSTPVAAVKSVQDTQLYAANDVHATYVYTIPWLCTSSTCPAVIGDYGVYQDPYHITSAYADYLSSVLEAALRLSGDLKTSSR